VGIIQFDYINDNKNDEEKFLMKKFTLLTILTVAIFSLTFLTSCIKKGYAATKPAGPYMVTLNINHNPPVAGENEVTLGIKDQSNKAVTDALVVIGYDMAAMPGMPAMSHKAEATLENNEYKATIDLMMAGPWTITVNIGHDGQTEKARFSIDAR